MASPIPASHADIFDKKSFTHLTTLMKDGSPQASPVWVERRDDHIVVNSAQGRVKDRNMRRDPRVAVSIIDPENPYRGLMIRGRVIEVTTDGAEEHIDALAQKYMNQPTYPYRSEGEVRVIYVIEPESVGTIGG